MEKYPEKDTQKAFTAKCGKKPYVIKGHVIPHCKMW